MDDDGPARAGSPPSLAPQTPAARAAAAAGGAAFVARIVARAAIAAMPAVAGICAFCTTAAQPAPPVTIALPIGLHSAGLGDLTPPVPSTPPPPTPRPADFRLDGLSCRGPLEIVTIGNHGDLPGDLAGWNLYAADQAIVFTFPSHLLHAGQSIYVYSGPAAPPSDERRFRWTTDPIWNDAFDSALLFSAFGAVVSSRSCAGPGPTTPDPRPPRAPSAHPSWSPR